MLKTTYQMISLGALLISLGCATTGNNRDNSEDLPKETDTTLQEEASSDTRQPAYRPTSSFNIPIVVNKEVEQFIRYFQTRHRRYFARWLGRSSMYIPLMEEILTEHGLPTDLVYLAMIESGFNQQARSSASAVGPWQFIRTTGIRYGLKINWWVDERKDPIKSSDAAARYLKDLYNMFDSWFLAAAGYNAGENKIKRAIRRHKTENFWEMTRYRYLKPETKQYVPKLIAAALIAKNPEKYGFHNVEFKEPKEYDLITVNQPIDLRNAALILDISYKDLKFLNPELLRWCTPPNQDQYTLRIPKGTKELFITHYEKIVPKNRTIFHAHEIRSGDTIYRIARKYNTQAKPIIELNKIKSVRLLRPGKFLIIPVQAQKRT
jgi:membrane-bound lytic murein transglycosylase D